MYVQKNLTRQEAHDRSEKGWHTRKYGKIAATAAGVAIGSRAILEHRFMTTHQHEWVRPNGERITFKGFAHPDDIAHVRGELANVDRHLKPSIKVAPEGGLLVRNRVPRLFEPDTTGLHLGDRKSRFNYIRKMVGANQEDWNQATPFLTAIDRAKGRPNHARIDIHPDFVEKNVLTHELAHAVDRGDWGISHSRRYKKASGWADTSKTKMMRKSREGIDIDWDRRGVATNATHNLDSYQYGGKGIEEDFAETFRGMLGKSDPERMGTPVLNPSRRKFMYQKILAEKPQAEGSFIPKHGIHEHYDKFLIGGVIVGAGGYGYYKYKTDPKFHNKVDRTVTGIKRRVTR